MKRAEYLPFFIDVAPAGLTGRSLAKALFFQNRIPRCRAFIEIDFERFQKTRGHHVVSDEKSQFGYLRFVVIRADAIDLRN